MLKDLIHFHIRLSIWSYGGRALNSDEWNCNVVISSNMLDARSIWRTSYSLRFNTKVSRLLTNSVYTLRSTRSDINLISDKLTNGVYTPWSSRSVTYLGGEMLRFQIYHLISHWRLADDTRSRITRVPLMFTIRSTVNDSVIQNLSVSRLWRLSSTQRCVKLECYYDLEYTWCTFEWRTSNSLRFATENTPRLLTNCVYTPRKDCSTI